MNTNSKTRSFNSKKLVLLVLLILLEEGKKTKNPIGKGCMNFLLVERKGKTE